MYGFQVEGGWSTAVGRELSSVMVAANLISLSFEPGLRVGVLSEISLRRSGHVGKIVAADKPTVDGLIELIGRSIIKVSRESEARLIFVMDGGQEIEFADSPGYESFVFELDGKTTYV